MPDKTDWLSASEDIIKSLILAGEDEPICMLIGAGASLSSGAPYTDEVVEAVRSARPGTFPDADSVYELGDVISLNESDIAIGKLFQDVVPNIGYRCLAAMARKRPIVVINMNWDSCVPTACEKLGLSAQDHRSLHLDDVKAVRAAWNAFKRRGRGVLSVHPHGLIEGGGMRFATKNTLKIDDPQLRLLRELLGLRTIVVGTSLSGPRDVTDLVRAMTPVGQPDPADLRFLWVLERGPRRREPGIDTQAGRELRIALDSRNSSLNFIAAPEVDFDVFMIMLRALEVGLSWDAWVREQPGDVDLPKLADLVMPNPRIARELLDTPNALLTGRAEVGKSVVAHLVAHWHAILAPSKPRLHKTTGRLEARNALAKLTPARKGSQAAAGAEIVICDDCLGAEPNASDGEELARLLPDANGSSRVVLASTPAELLAASSDRSRLTETVNVTVLEAARTWTAEALRQYARRLAEGRPEMEAALVGRVDRCELKTPIQVRRAAEGASSPKEREEGEQSQLREHVEGMCRTQPDEALLLALMRLQDLSHPRTRRELVDMTKAAVENVSTDPWDLTSSFQMDEEYLRLSDDRLLAAVDHCIERHRRPLQGKMAKGGERLRWALDALSQWDALRGTVPTASAIEALSDFQCEMFGAKLVEKAMEEESSALEVLEALRVRAHDEWALKDLALTLLEHWDRLQEHEGALALRDRFLEDDERSGSYALFEGLLRRGGWAPPALWHPVEARMLDMALGRSFNGTEQTRRRQVALCFDALLWRRAPAEGSEHAILLRELVRAASGDPLLKSMFAVAVAYHHNHARSLHDLGLLDLLDIGDVTEDRAQEMAWMVAWHFVHQSRNRAVASRRFFNSTHASTRIDGQRLLDRHFQERDLPEDWVKAIEKVASALGKWSSTAGWGLHLIMNIQATAGRFTPHKLKEVVQRASHDDPGVVSAAIAYAPSGPVLEAVRPLVCSQQGRAALLAALGEGVLVNGVRVISPRFLLTHDEWGPLRARWRINDEDLWSCFESLSAKTSSDRWQVLEAMEESVPEALQLGAKEMSVRRALNHFRRGDTRPFERTVAGIVMRKRQTKGPRTEERKYGWLLKAAAIWLEENAPLEDA